MMEMTDISMTFRMVSFTVKENSQFWNATVQNRIPIMLTMDGITETDQEALESATLYYYSEPTTGTTCEVDRFDCYPL